MLREIGKKQYSKEVYSDADMLLNFNVLGAVDLNKSLTYLWGRNSNQFPLLSLTEGQGNISRKKPINAGDTQYKWKIMGKPTVTSPIVRLITPTQTPGKGFMSFKAEFQDNWIPYQYSAITPDGKHLVRMQTDGEQTASGGYIYEMIILGGNPDEFIDLSNFERGKYWGMGAPTIAGELSTGSRSTAESWSEMTNQFGFHRFSKIITGNIANIVTEFELDYDDGSKGTLWMPYEMRQFEFMRRRLLEEDLWFSSYNRDINGVIHNQEKHSNKPIPRGAGVRDILIAFGNYFEYSFMTIELIDMILSRIFEVRNDIDLSNKNIVLYTGKGGSKMFQQCIKNEAIGNGYFDKLGAEEIQSRGGILSYVLTLINISITLELPFQLKLLTCSIAVLVLKWIVRTVVCTEVFLLLRILWYFWITLLIILQVNLISNLFVKKVVNTYTVFTKVLLLFLKNGVLTIRC